MADIGQLTEGQRVSTAELLKLLKAPHVELGRFQSTHRGRHRPELVVAAGP